MEKISTSKIILSYFVRALGLFLLLFTIMAAYLGFSGLQYLNTLGDVPMRIDLTAENKDFFVVSYVEKKSIAEELGIQVGDTIVKVNNVSVTKDFDAAKVIGRQTIGSKIKYTFKKGGGLRDVELTFSASGTLDKIITVLFKTIPVMLMFLYVAVGFWGLIKSPHSNETILIALFCFCFGCFTYATVSTGADPDNFVKKYLYFDGLKQFIQFLMWFGPSFWVLLFVTLPKKNRFYERNKFFTLFFIFLLPIIATALILTQVNNRYALYLVFALIFVYMGTGVYLLNYNAKHVSSMLEKRQVRLMLFGVKYGAMSIGLGWLEIMIVQFVIINFIDKDFLILGFIIFLTFQVGGLIIPFTFLNSFFQNKLLETENALKKRVRYFGVTFLLLGIYFIVIFVLGRLSVVLFDLRDPTMIIILVLLLSLTFTPINKLLLKWLDERFYPERTKYANSLKGFIQKISVQIESGELLQTLSQWISSTTGIMEVIPIAFNNQLSVKIPFKQKDIHSVINRVKDGDKFFWDEISERSKTTVDENEIEWARENNISVTIPMLSQGELVGLLNLGKKQTDEDFTAEDLDIVTQASNQAALALQNLKLQTENIDKKRMDKELDMARGIQKNLLPQSIPVIDGLDVFGESRPCYEIAGDYFDIIKTKTGNTILVVGDVSGKGAGAAMIMANLQASIRLGIQLSDELESMVAMVNDLIYNNTSPSEFITFFIGVWKPAEKTFYYVNAGHNPPIVIDKNNKAITLDATGLIMGILPGQKYESSSVKIEKDSILVIYTDGLEEAMNKKDEQFGLERIIQTVIDNKEMDSKGIIKVLENEAEAYCGGRILHDDVTMIVAKGI